MKPITVIILRSDPGGDMGPRFLSYSVPYCDGITVLRALDYIYEKIDSTLAYRPFRCYKGVCHSCLMLINQQRKRACSTVLRDGESVTLEPLPDFPLIRDLVVDFI